MVYKKFQLLCLSCVVCVLQLATVCQAAINVFGDSLSETGNFSIASEGLLPPDSLYYGHRFSNGPVWVEYLATAVGEPAPSPSLAGGTNWAFNGARAAGDSPYGTPDLVTQVAGFLATKGGVADPDDYYVIWAGANDIFFGSAAGKADYIPNALTGISQSIRTLYEAGARKFVVLNLPLLGQTPFFNRDPFASAALNSAASAFNTNLARQLSRVRHDLHAIRIAAVKIDQLFTMITRAPRWFGFQNVTDSSTLFDPVSGIGYALAPGVDPNRYLFWDSVHPTARGHQVIALRAYIDVKIHCIDHRD